LRQKNATDGTNKMISKIRRLKNKWNVLEKSCTRPVLIVRDHLGDHRVKTHHNIRGGAGSPRNKHDAKKKRTGRCEWEVPKKISSKETAKPT